MTAAGRLCDRFLPPPLGEVAPEGAERAKVGGVAMSVPKNNKMLEVARQLRREMTPQERKLWYLFLRDFPVKIYKQRIVGSFVVDFDCHAAKLVVEVDGGQHRTAQGRAYDQQRTLVLEKYGLSVLRFSNVDVERRFEWACEQIAGEIVSRQASGKS